jgi:hypothetical protein
VGPSDASILRGQYGNPHVSFAHVAFLTPAAFPRLQIEVADVSRRAALVGIAVAIDAFGFSSYSVSSPDNTGVIFNASTGSLRTGRVPFITQVQGNLTHYVPIQWSVGAARDPRKATTASICRRERATASLKIFRLRWIRVKARRARTVKAFRGAAIADIEATFIRRTIITIAHNTAATQTFLKSSRQNGTNFRTAFRRVFRSILRKMGFHLDKVNLGASHLPWA